MKSVICSFHVDELQGCHRYDMILGRDIFSKLNIDLCFSNNTLRGNWGAYKEWTALIKGILKLISNNGYQYNKEGGEARIIIFESFCATLCANRHILITMQWIVPFWCFCMIMKWCMIFWILLFGTRQGIC